MTTLADIAPLPGLVHITAEINGYRFYIGSDVSWHSAKKIALDYKAKFERARFYLTDKAGSTVINGFNAEFQNEYKGVNQ